MGLGSLALDFQGDIRAALVPDLHLISGLIAALIKDLLHLVADRGGVGKGMIFHRVRDPAHLNPVVQHAHDGEFCFDGFC